MKKVMKAVVAIMLMTAVVCAVGFASCDSNQNYVSINGHEYVDLGLPSGTLWATCNVGANSPEEYGDYFAWGETTMKAIYNLETYQFANGNDARLTKYCDDSSYGYNGFTDNLTTFVGL